MEKYTLPSVHTGQEYEILIRKPEDYNPDWAYTLVYIADGSYGVGHFLLRAENNIQVPEHCVIIAISHTGPKEKSRDRDFIPSDISNNAREDFGQAHQFYNFIKDELSPFVSAMFINSSRQAFIGHSLSGLFCLYMALQPENLFDHYFAISPSVWANHFELLKIEKEFSKTHQDLPANISIYSGSLEVFNLIIISGYLFVKAITKRNYPNLHVTYSVITGKQHQTIRKPALDRIMHILNL